MNVAGVDLAIFRSIPTSLGNAMALLEFSNLALSGSATEGFSVRLPGVGGSNGAMINHIDLSANTERYNLGGIHHGVLAVTMVVGHF
jgi:hypothetical protein